MTLRDNATDPTTQAPKRRYVALSAELLEAFLREKGFERIVQFSEIVYVRRSHIHPSVRVKVYTSIRAGESTVRASGADAIRVTAAYESDRGIALRRDKPARNSFGIFKAKKILRTGSEEAILNRLYDRMREAYGFANHWLYKNWQTVAGKGVPFPQPSPPARPSQPQVSSMATEDKSSE